MTFGTDHEQLLCWVRLDDEPEDLQLDGDEQLGEQILDLLQEALLESTAGRHAPDGTPWAELRPSTVRQKGHSLIGLRTGEMLWPGRFEAAPRDVQARLATWQLLPVDGKTLSFHAGNPRTGQVARPIVGWSEGVQADARNLIADAVFRLDADGDPQE